MNERFGVFGLLLLPGIVAGMFRAAVSLFTERFENKNDVPSGDNHAL